MKYSKNLQITNEAKKILGVNVLVGILSIVLFLFAGPASVLHAAEQGTWTYNEEDGRYCYVDKNGWVFEMNKKTDDSCILKSVPEDMKGELNIPSKIRLDSIVRQVDLSYYFVVPEGITKVYLPDLSPYNENDDYPYEDYLNWFEKFSEDDETVLTVYCYEGDYYKKYLECFKFKIEYLDPALAEVVGGEEEDNWSYNAKKGSYCYTDEKGWKYDMTTKEDESYILWSIPADIQGEITIPAEITIDGKIRKLHHLDNERLQIPKGVTKVVFEKGISYFSGPLFDQCSPDLVVSCYLEGTGYGISDFVRSKGFKVEYQNGYTDQNGITYYATQQTKKDGTKGALTGAVCYYDGSAENITVASQVTIQGVNYQVTLIDQGAFMDTKVKKVTLPDTITVIGSFAFENCKALNSMKLPKKLTELGANAFAGCTSLTSIQLPSGITSLYTQTFYGCTSLKKVVLSKKTQHIGDYVFCDCKKLTSITNLEQLTFIGQEAFASCKKLTSLTFGKKLSNIGAAAFYKCTSLKSVTIESKSMEYIGSMAFYGNKKLKSLTLKATNLTSKKICKDTFQGTGKKMIVKVPAKKVNAYSKFLKKCGNKTIIIKKI